MIESPKAVRRIAAGALIASAILLCPGAAKALDIYPKPIFCKREALLLRPRTKRTTGYGPSRLTTL